MSKSNGSGAKSPAINLGELQTGFTVSKRALAAAEAVLHRAQEARDRARTGFAVAEAALRDGTRALLG